MLRRFLLGVTFLAAFATVGVGITDSAQAWRRWGWGRPYVSYYAPPQTYYYNGYAPYRTYYYGPTDYYGPTSYRPYRPSWGGYY